MWKDRVDLMKGGCKPETEKVADREHCRGVKWGLWWKHVRPEIFITSCGEAQ